jgi:hypothetical protein
VEYEELRDSRKVISAVRSEDRTERRYIHTSCQSALVRYERSRGDGKGTYTPDSGRDSMSGMFPQFIHLNVLFGIEQIDEILRMGCHL